MYEKVLNKYAVKQIAYVVNDVEDACKKMAECIGAGPFVFIPDYSPAKATYKGKEVKVVLDQAYGAYGDLQIEIIKVPDEGDVTVFGKTGFHHFAIWVDDVEEAVADFKKAGFDVALRMESDSGLVISFIDCTETLGHYIEIYNPQEGLFNMNQAMAEGWNGANPFMHMSDLQK